MLCPTILMLLALAPFGFVQAADMAIDCRLKGGTVVQLPANACKLEGGAPVSAEVAITGDSKLDVVKRSIVNILAKTVETTTPLNRNPEGIARSAKFDGCRLIVDEELHIQYGNLFPAWKDFKISSVIDLQKIEQNEYGVMGKVTSRGGELTGVAVSFEERKRKGGNDISISVLNLRKGSYTKYTTHGPSAYWDAPEADLWIADEYGYAKDNGWDAAATDKIRILYIVNSADDAALLKNALDEVHALCRPQQAGADDSKGQGQ